MKFGRLTAVKRVANRVDKSGRSRIFWLCKCSCGNTIEVNADNLYRGKVNSCGCYLKELMSKTKSSHRASNTKLYGIWCSIKSRCYNHNTKYYEYYGGKGIYMCDEWLNNYESFRDWSLDNGYKEGLTIDRIDCDKSYTPDNCRWITQKEQCNNRTSNVVYSMGGQTHNITEWADIYGINPKTLFSRIYSGKSFYEAINFDNTNKRC